MSIEAYFFVFRFSLNFYIPRLRKQKLIRQKCLFSLRQLNKPQNAINSLMLSQLTNTFFFQSPTDLNTSRRLGDKPSPIKNVNIVLDSNQRLEDELNAVLSCSTMPTSNQQPLNVVSQSSSHTAGNTSIVGYVNEKNSSEGFSNSENCSSEDKW